jgi:hypothetical protein
MDLNVGREVAALKRLTVKGLQARYAEVFGEGTNCHNRDWLVKRIAWRVQALAEGDLSERARWRAAELARDADLRTTVPAAKPTATIADDHTSVRAVRFEPDDRLPPPGTVLARRYKGDEVQVKVLETGFEYDGRVFGSLSGVAKAVTGSHCNGYLFFRLGGKGGDA